MNISSGNGLDKSTADLAEVRTELIGQLDARVEALNGHDHGAARCLAGPGDENLAVAVFLQLARVRMALRLGADHYEVYCLGAHLLLSAAFEESKDKWDHLHLAGVVRKINTAITEHCKRWRAGGVYGRAPFPRAAHLDHRRLRPGKDQQA